MLTLTKVAETSTTVTLTWMPPPTVDVYVFYAGNTMVSFAGRNNKDGTQRTLVKFSKTNPGAPFHVVAVCHPAPGEFALESGMYPAEAPPPPPPSGILTGTHWAETNDYATLKGIGYGFAVTNVAPGDVSGAQRKLDAAKAAGIRLVIGLYAFGGPEPYTLKTDGTWAVTDGGRRGAELPEGAGVGDRRVLRVQRAILDGPRRH